MSHPEMASMEIDLVERLDGGWIKFLDHKLDVNDFVGRDVCVRIIHEMGFIHYVPLYEILHSKNYVPDLRGT